MIGHRCTSAVIVAAGVGVASCCWTVAAAQTPAAVDAIADNDGIFIDAVTFRIVRGKANGDAAKRVDKLGAREMGAGALVFRARSRLYIVETPTLALTSADRKGTVDVDEERPNRIRIEYVPPKNPEHRQLYEMLKERQALETLQQIFAPLRLPLEVTIRMVGCDGVPNALYERQGKQPIITLCYEYLQEIMQKMPKEMTAAGLSPHDVVVGQFLYAALHELGHAAFDLYDVPVFGREEDAADLFATYVMLQFRNNQARKFLGGAAYSYMEFIQAGKDKPNVTVPLLAFSSDHGTPEERFYNLLCITYGSDQNMFADLVEKEYLPKSRAAGCKYEFQVLRYAFRNQIMPHIDQTLAERVLEMRWFAEPAARAAAR